MEAMADSTEVFLNDIWSLYFHDPYDDKWDKESYKLLCNISTIQELQQAHKAFADIWTKGMFFLMREHVLPLWEDESNMNGGCLSFKIMKPEVSEEWFKLCAQALGETFLVDGRRKELWGKVTGISISPKRNYCILRIWLSSREVSDLSNYTLHVPPYTSVLFKPHQENKDYENSESAVHVH